MEEKHLAALLVERAAADLRSQVTINGACPLPLADIKFLVSDNCRSKVWSGTSLSFALWNSRTKELLRVFNIDGQVENKGDISSGHDPYDEETKVKLTSTSKKEKSKESVSFFQRSRNALMGAADAVRRVASKSAFGEENKKTEAMIISMDGMIWTGLNNGMLVQWDGNASRLQEVQHHSSSVQCLFAFGTRIWVGYMSGHIQILDLEGNLLGGWVAHSSPVIKLAVGGDYIFTLANHGGIRGWSLTSPGPTDDILRCELTLKESLFSKREHVKIMVGSWNVGQERAAHDSLVSWVGCASSEADVVVVGLQEVDMGAGFLAMAAAKETVGLEGSANGHWWMDNIGKTLGEGTIFERVGSRQLAALLISAWARKSIKKHIGDIDAGAVACGFGRAIGNKGSVSLRMRIYDRIVCFANCHLAAHLEAVNKRNADFDHIYRNMSYSRTLTANVSATAGSSSAVQVLRGSNATVVPSDDGSPELAEADMVVFFGDFNYRLYGITYDEARDIVSQRCFDWLREKDQLRAEMKAGKVFQGMREGLIRFPPTYKFERHKSGLAGYDSGEKKRIPAWCDRILYRDNRSLSVEECSLECPVVTSILQYEACMDVNDSDHKPIRCIYSVSIARIDELIRRQQFGEILFSNGKIKALLEELYTIPEAFISTNDIILQSQNTSLLHVTNTSEKETALFEICCHSQASSKEEGPVLERNPRGAFGLPRWLEVTPVNGIIKPEGTAEVSVRHEETRSLEDLADSMAPDRIEESKDRQVTLVVNIMRGFSTRATSHQVTVHLRLPSKLAANGTQFGSSKRTQSIHKPELQHLDSNTEVVDDSKNLQGP